MDQSVMNYCIRTVNEFEEFLRDLEANITAHRIKKADLAKQLNMSPSTLYRRLRSGRFKVSELKIITEMLNTSDQSIN